MARHEESRTSPPAPGFFILPRVIRDNIYARVLVVPHALLLSQESPTRWVESSAPGKPPQWPALLLVSHQMHAEACQILYGQNRFNLVDTAASREAAVLRSYLASIGSTNASLLSHLCISFPVFNVIEGRPEETAAGDNEGLSNLQLLRENCTNLGTLEAYVHHRNSKALVQASPHGDSTLVRETLARVDGQLKAVISLTKIVVRFYDGHPAALVKQMMQGFGWVVLVGDEDS